MRYAIMLLVLSGLLGTALQPPEPPEWSPLTREAIVTDVERALESYVFPAKVPAMESVLEAHRKEYVAITDPEHFASAITADLYTAANDKHIIVRFSPIAIPQDRSPRGDDARRAMSMANNGFTGVLRLRGNVGYLRIDGFAGMPESKAAIDGAMALLTNTDALIIDLRTNRGGDPASLDYFMGYFYEKPVELTGIVQTGGTTRALSRQFSAESVAGPRYLEKPIYVLTSSETFSCGEQFAYDMQSLHRATLIGETTGGGANPGDEVRLADHFAVFVPTGYALNPYTHANWEGVGVVPEIPVEAKAALLEAYQRALRDAKNEFPMAAQARQRALVDPAAALAQSLPNT